MKKVYLWVLSGVGAICIGLLVLCSQAFLHLDASYTVGLPLAIIITLALFGLGLLMSVAKSVIHLRWFQTMAWVEMFALVAFCALGIFSMAKSNQFFSVVTNSGKIKKAIVDQATEIEPMVSGYNDYARKWIGWRDQEIYSYKNNADTSAIRKLFGSLSENYFKSESEKAIKLSPSKKDSINDLSERLLKYANRYNIFYFDMSDVIEDSILIVENYLTQKIDTVKNHAQFGEINVESEWQPNRVGKPGVEKYYTTPAPIMLFSILTVALLCLLILLPYFFTRRENTNSGPFVEAFRKRF